MNRLRKPERLNKKKIIEKMFAGGSRSFSIFPLRVVWLPVEELDVQASILISVSKRRFKRAVKRNRVKRQIREAYRMNKPILLDSDALNKKEYRLAIAFIYLADELMDSTLVEEKMKTALARIVEEISVEQMAPSAE
ncbi:ribonuclease P protein component [uncultured Bacteroides sp.]|uniref:ribonuclease P protein component n=1 Tax=uncultured Bacteroides sp. TaxID=162156 RepID=UPI0026036E29|nr:ribonuclease P protein component [uncultured Bacteroides sp.]